MGVATFKFNVTNLAPLGDTTQDLVTYYGTLSFSAAADTYATGGLAPTTGFAITTLGPYADRALLDQNIIGSGSLEYRWNAATSKLMIFAGGGSGTSGTTEVTNGTALNGVTPNVFTDVITFRLTFPRR